MNKDIMREYAQLKAEQAKIEKKLSDLNPQVIRVMGKEKTIESKVGKFTQVTRKNYIFSLKLREYERKLKNKVNEKKEKEIDKGAAWNEATSLRYDFPKTMVN